MSIEEKKDSQTFQGFNNIYKPKDEREVSNFIKENYNKNLSIEIIGSGSKNFIGNKLKCEKILSLSELSGIIEYHPEELYIKVKACTPIIDIEKILENNNQELGFEPIDFGFIKNSVSNKGSAGGYLSSNFSGSRRFKVGSVRDHILGFRGVNGKGEIIKSGGTVVKNVTGYDLSKLVTGSFGTLIALTEITFKVLPKKTSSSTVAIHTDDINEVVTYFDRILNSSNEISGSVYIPQEPKNKNYNYNKEKIFKFNDLKYTGSFLAFRIEGTKKSIEERIKDISAELELKKKQVSVLDVYQSLLFWEKINNLELFSSTRNTLLRVVIPPLKKIDLIKYLKENFKYYIDWCGSLFWIEVLDNDLSKIEEIKEKVVNFGGYLTIIKKSENHEKKVSVFTVDKTRLLLSEKIKESFDPKKILNPGKMYIGI